MGVIFNRVIENTFRYPDKLSIVNHNHGSLTYLQLRLNIEKMLNFLDGDIDEMLDSLKAQSNAEKLLEIQHE